MEGFNSQNGYSQQQMNGFNQQSNYQQPIQGFDQQQNMYGQQPMQGFNPQQNYQQPYGYQTVVNKNPTLTRDIILSIVQIIILGSWITGILSLIFTLTANDKFTKGLYQEYENNTKYGRIARIVGYILFGILIILLFLFIIGLEWTYTTMA